jgi:hypothetical protein
LLYCCCCCADYADDTYGDDEDEDIEEEVYEPPTTTTQSANSAKPRPQRDTVGPVFNEEPELEVYVTPAEPISIVCDVTGS